MRGPDGKVVHAEYVLTDGTVDVGGQVVAQDARKGIVLRPDRRAAAPGLAGGRALSAGHLVGTRRHVHAARLPRRLGDGRAAERPVAVHEADDGGRVGRRPPRRAGERRADGDRAADASRSTRHGESCVVRFTVSPTAVPRGRHQRPEPRPARARRPLHAVHVQARLVRIAFDVSPLSHPRTGVGNYIRGSLRGAGRGGGRRARGRSRSRRPAPGEAADPGGARRHPGRAAPPVSARSRTSGARRWSRVGWPPVERLPRTGRRAALLGLDVSAAARRDPLDDDPRPRAAAVPRVGAGPDGADARREVPERRAHLRRGVRQLVVHGAGGGELLGVPSEKIVVAYPGVVARGRGRRADLGAAVRRSPSRRSSRARTSTTLLAAPLPEGHALAVVGAAGWGPQPKLDRPDVIRLGYVDDDGARAPVPRRRRVRLPVALRGVRDPGRRGDGGRRAGGRVRARVDGRGRRRRRRACRPERPGGDRRRASRRRCAAATGSSRAGSRTRRASRWGETGRVDAGGVLRMRVGLDTSPLVQTQAGTARYIRALLAAQRVRAALLRRAHAAGDDRPRCLVVPARSAAARPAASTSSTARRSAALYAAASRW